MRLAAAAGALLFIVLVGIFTVINARELPPEVLVQRCDACAPAWNGYQEDIKEIGARPVAAWRGEPVAVTVSPEEVRVTLHLFPPWDGYTAALPLLLKDPEGRVHRNGATMRDGALRIYIFEGVAGSAVAFPPWLDLQYPHTKRRIYLDSAGQWAASPEIAG